MDPATRVLGKKVNLSDCPGREALDVWARGAAVPSPLQLGMGVWIQCGYRNAGT